MSSNSEGTVTVTKPSNSVNMDPTDTHRASEFVVRDGHLYVETRESTIAVYAPGKWVSAVVS